MKPETEIRNLKRDLAELRVVCEGFGMPLLIIYLPALAIADLKKKEPRRLTRKQKNWLKEKMNEFKKLLRENTYPCKN